MKTYWVSLQVFLIPASDREEWAASQPGRINAEKERGT